MVATPARRRSIVCDQKFPKPFKAAQYTEAYPELARFIECAGDRSILASALRVLTRAEPAQEFLR
jgi:hypothetical protein